MTERETLAFENAYEGTPSWEIGRPQGAIVRAADAGRIVGTILDVGCGTGAHARFLAARGHPVVGLDFSVRAIERARAGVPTSARFEVADVRSLEAAAPLRAAFDSVLDCGCFHTLQPGDRPAYERSIRAVLHPGGRLVLLAWSDRNPFGRGPARVKRSEIRTTFRDGWIIEAIEAEALESRLPPGRIHAWLAILQRTVSTRE